MRLVRTQATGLNLTLRADTPEEEAFLQHLVNAPMIGSRSATGRRSPCPCTGSVSPWT